MFEKKAETREPIHDLLARRWSGRAFDAGRPVSRAQLIALLEAARWAPSCYGAEPWAYIICDRSADAERWNAACACLSEGNRAWAGSAPVLLLAGAAREFSRDGSANRWAQYDAGAASMSLCLQATAMGLMAHQMGGFDPQKARAAFQLPDRIEPMAMIAVGYQLAEREIPETLHEREHAPRRRRPLRENFFIGTWGRGMDR